MIEPKFYSYEEFPESKAFADGIQILPLQMKNEFCDLHMNVPYAIKDDRVLHLNIIVPPRKTDAQKFPLILFIQGSGWMEQDLSSNLVSLLRFAEKGYVIAIAEYRPATVAPFPAQIKDAKTAARFMIKNADKYYADADRIVVWGDSSGAHTALLAGLTTDNNEFDDEWAEENKIHFNAIVDYYGPTDISKMNDEPSIDDHFSHFCSEGMLIGVNNVLERPDLVKPVIPMTYISSEREIPPILIMHGSKDRIVPFHQSVLLYECLNKHNKEVECYQMKGSDHGGPAFWTPETFHIVQKFIEKHV